MNQNLPAQNIPRPNFSNPVIAVTAILTVGVCYSSVPSTDEPS